MWLSTWREHIFTDPHTLTSRVFVWEHEKRANGWWYFTRGSAFCKLLVSPMLKPFLWQKIGCMKLNFQLWVEQSKTDDSLAETHFFLLNGLIFHDTDDDFYTWEADIVIRSQWVAWMLYFAYKSCVRFCASREWFKNDGIMAKKAWIFFLVHTCLWSLRDLSDLI